MGKTLAEITQQLRGADKKVQLIYAFNGTGKTRLSREFKQLIAPKANGGGEEGDETDQSGMSRNMILYYNAFTEDLFYWDNDLAGDTEPRLKIQPNSFTDWVLRDQGQDQNIIATFQRYTNQRMTPRFSADFAEVTFSLEGGNAAGSGNLKISRSEEGNFIWSIFSALLEQVIGTLNAEPGARETDQFDRLEYVFIDDPVSSLDENHLIELAVNLAGLIKSSQSGPKFIITTHSPLFYNVLHNELNLSKKGRNEGCYLLERHEDGSFDLTVKQGDSNKSFSYHLYLKETIEQAIADGNIQKYHFTLLRNLYEKTAAFLGYPNWSDLLPDDKQVYLNRIIQFASHSTLSNEAVADPTPQEKQTVRLLLGNLIDNYGYWQRETNNG